MVTSDFGSLAASWDSDPLKVERAQTVAREIGRRFDLPHKLRILEIGAGTGLVSQHLANLSGELELTLLEPSGGMRTVIEQKVAAGILPKNARIWEETLEERSPARERFDLVVSVMAMHHLPEVSVALRLMHELLASRGRLVVVDLEAEDGSFHPPGFSGHPGFDPSSFGQLLQSVGVADIQVTGNIFAMEKNSRSYPLFMASGTAGRTHCMSERTNPVEPSLSVEVGQRGSI